jgi:uncharacterized protein YjiS (DUF1127 family)
MDMHIEAAPPPFLPDALLLARSRCGFVLGQAIRSAAAWTLGPVARLYVWARVRLTRRHVRRAPHSLDDRMLADIGPARSDIESIVNEAVPHRTRRRSP